MSEKQYKVNVYVLRKLRIKKVKYLAWIQVECVHTGKIINRRFKSGSATRAAHVLANMVLDPSLSVGQASTQSFSAVLQ